MGTDLAAIKIYTDFKGPAKCRVSLRIADLEWTGHVDGREVQFSEPGTIEFSNIKLQAGSLKELLASIPSAVAEVRREKSA